MTWIIHSLRIVSTKKTEKTKTIYIKALDTIFTAMQGLRVYQNMGIKKVTEDIDELQSQTIVDLMKAERMWNWIDCDWIDKDTGECLTGYTPDAWTQELISNIK